MAACKVHKWVKSNVKYLAWKHCVDCNEDYEAFLEDWLRTSYKYLPDVYKRILRKNGLGPKKTPHGRLIRSKAETAHMRFPFPKEEGL